MPHPLAHALTAARAGKRRLRLGVLAAVAATTGVLVPLSGAMTAGPASAALFGPACHGSPLGGLPGRWTCTFDDEFGGTTLNVQHWQPQLTARSGYVAGPDCYVDNPDTIKVAGGYLRLSVAKVAPFTCAGGYTTPYEAGMVTSYDLFSQTYGAFEVRAKIPQAAVAGLQETLWLYPQVKPTTQAEIDFAEFYSNQPGLDIPYIHYANSSSDPNATAHNCTINPAAYNIYEVAWTPTSISIFYNGTTCVVDQPNGGPAPFNQPFFIALTQALGMGTNAPTSSTPFPDTTMIDWVRVWSQTS